MTSAAITSAELSNPSKKRPLPNSVIVYSDNNTANILTSLISGFEDIFTDIEKTIDISKE